MRRFAVLMAAVLGLCGAGAYAQQEKPLGAKAQQMPEYLKEAGIVQRLNQPLPLDAAFVDDAGKPIVLGTYFHQRPIALALVYFKCRMMCPQVMHGLAVGLKETRLKAGKDFDVVIASIDPKDTPEDAAASKKTFLAQMGQPGAGDSVHFLTGQPASIAALSGATGFNYVPIPGPDGKMDQFAHSSVVMFATPEGKMSQYLSGIDFSGRDVRLALVDASHLKIATAKDLFLIYCCNYEPSSGKYTVAVLRLLGLSGMVTLVGIGFGLYFVRRSRSLPGRPA
ncbi:MAG TPA: SCO family protein [Edaphobacter sp.]|nr:SCO family protein [Edaphobacter sp.]